MARCKTSIKLSLSSAIRYQELGSKDACGVAAVEELLSAGEVVDVVLVVEVEAEVE